MNSHNPENSPVLVRRTDAGISIILNKQETINSLTLEMVRSIATHLNEALADDECKLILFYGAGSRGFCAGGDLKRLALDIRNNNIGDVNQFFLEEYHLDLAIQRCPKPVIVIADGITMGGGLGIAAGADWVIATENTRMAMPETRIGFFPDVGATGWMHSKCPPGYPEYLGLTSYEMQGSECVRLGFASHLTHSEKVYELIRSIENFKAKDISHAKELLPLLMRRLKVYFYREIMPKPDVDQWVAEYFASKSSLPEIIESLQTCRIHMSPCDGILSGLSERSPTALALTLKLLRYNEHLPMDRVYETDFQAIQFIIRHPDYLEGIRARLIDRDNKPRWQPDSLEKVDLSLLRL
ncbi:MAG: enoyl-CoA hydratase/isomerase family protein [Deltaproteobacteria bacterium]|nr:enoyl-CoA hydratase/isomerase family protein [Deltaproteobacteria bacterium]